MNTLLKIIAYFCIATTPIQIFVVLWGIQVVLSSDYQVLTLSNIEFIQNHFTLVLPIVDWFYSWFWNTWLNFVFSLPLILSQIFKAIVSTWLGFWILKKINWRHEKNTSYFCMPTSSFYRMGLSLYWWTARPRTNNGYGVWLFLWWTRPSF